MQPQDDSAPREAAEAAVELRNRAGIHARSAAALIREAARFQATVTIQAGAQRARGRSLTELLRLGARQGDTLRITADGPDAAAAVAALAALVERGFDEE